MIQTWRQFPIDRLVLALSTLGLGLLAFAMPMIPLDDAYITLHNARALLAGGQDAVYGGHAVDGATSIVHLAMVTAAGLVMPLELGSRLIGIGAVALLAAGMVRIARAGGAPILGALVALGGALVPITLTNGLESGLAMAAVAWSIVLVNSRWLCLLAGLLPFIRPELGLLGLLLLGRQVWQMALGGDRRSAVVRLLGALLVATPWLAWQITATGDILPDTGATKIAWYGESGLLPMEKLRNVVAALSMSGLLPLLIGLVGLRAQAGGWMLMLFVLLWLGAAGWTLPGGLAHNHGRYLAMLVPIAVYGWMGLGTARLTTYARSLVFMVTLLTGAAAVLDWLDKRDMHAMADLRADQAAIPTHARVLVHDAGYLAWLRPDLALVDVVGLKSPANGALHRRWAGRACARALAIGAIAAASRPDYLVVLDDRPVWQDISPALRGHGWTLHRINPLRPDGYALYRIAPPPPGMPAPRCAINPAQAKPA